MSTIPAALLALTVASSSARSALAHLVDLEEATASLIAITNCSEEFAQQIAWREGPDETRALVAAIAAGDMTLADIQRTDR